MNQYRRSLGFYMVDVVAAGLCGEYVEVVVVVLGDGEAAQARLPRSPTGGLSPGIGAYRRARAACALRAGEHRRAPADRPPHWEHRGARAARGGVLGRGGRGRGVGGGDGGFGGVVVTVVLGWAAVLTGVGLAAALGMLVSAALAAARSCASDGTGRPRLRPGWPEPGRIRSSTCVLGGCIGFKAYDCPGADVHDRFWVLCLAARLRLDSDCGKPEIAVAPLRDRRSIWMSLSSAPAKLTLRPSCASRTRGP